MSIMNTFSRLRLHLGVIWQFFLEQENVCSEFDITHLCHARPWCTGHTEDSWGCVQLDRKLLRSSVWNSHQLPQREVQNLWQTKAPRLFPHGRLLPTSARDQAHVFEETHEVRSRECCSFDDSEKEPGEDPRRGIHLQNRKLQRFFELCFDQTLNNILWISLEKLVLAFFSLYFRKA